MDGRVDVVLGAQRPQTQEEDQQHYVAKYEDTIFPETIVNGFDLAIIVLPQRVRFTDFVQPVLLPRWSDKGRQYDGEQGIINGWLNDSFFKTAGYENVEISNHLECGSGRKPDILCIADKVISGGENGAPLVLETADGLEVVGIFSFHSLFQKGGPEFIHTNVFIKINEQLEFIANNTGIFIRP